jgi:hypothetical protein
MFGETHRQNLAESTSLGREKDPFRCAVFRILRIRVKDPDVAVEHVLVIVVARLHDAVARAKERPADFPLRLARRGRIERGLQESVEIHHARRAGIARADVERDVVKVDVEVLGEVLLAFMSSMKAGFFAELVAHGADLRRSPVDRDELHIPGRNRGQVANDSIDARGPEAAAYLHDDHGPYTGWIPGNLRPVDSSTPIIRLRHCTAFPAAPLIRLLLLRRGGACSHDRRAQSDIAIIGAWLLFKTIHKTKYNPDEKRGLYNRYLLANALILIFSYLMCRYIILN